MEGQPAAQQRSSHVVRRLPKCSRVAVDCDDALARVVLNAAPSCSAAKVRETLVAGTMCAHWRQTIEGARGGPGSRVVPARSWQLGGLMGNQPAPRMLLTNSFQPQSCLGRCCPHLSRRGLQHMVVVRCTGVPTHQQLAVQACRGAEPKEGLRAFSAGASRTGRAGREPVYT